MKFETLLHYSVISNTPGWNMMLNYFSFFEKTSRTFIETRMNLQNESYFYRQIKHMIKCGIKSGQSEWCYDWRHSRRWMRVRRELLTNTAGGVPANVYKESSPKYMCITMLVICRRIIGICDNPVATCSIWSIIWMFDSVPT